MDSAPPQCYALREVLRPMKKQLLWILSILFLLGGCKAAPVSPTPPAQTPVPTAPAPTPAPEPAPLSAPDVAYDETGLAQWQKAYLAFLRELCAREAPIRRASGGALFYNGDPQLSSSYALYDIDKDGVPELFLEYGSTATEVYTVRDGAAVLCPGEELYLNSASLYTWPGENGVLYRWGRMGGAFMNKISLVDGVLVTQADIFTEGYAAGPEAVEDYTDPSQVVPGAEYIDPDRTFVTLPGYAPLALPIYRYGLEQPLPTACAGENRAAIGAVLAGQRPLYGVSGDGFGGDTGWLYFEEYCLPGAASAYAEHPLYVEAEYWLDLNGDGQEECVLTLGEEDGDTGIAPPRAVLSYQDGVVYAYCVNHASEHVLREDGSFSAGGWCFSLSFWKNQCTRINRLYVPGAPPAAQA